MQSNFPCTKRLSDWTVAFICNIPNNCHSLTSAMSQRVIGKTGEERECPRESFVIGKTVEERESAKKSYKMKLRVM